MTEYNYDQVIEYIDGTYDENFNNAQKWAYSHNTTFEEDMEKRDLPKRYFVIGDKPEEPSEEEIIEQKKAGVRMVRNLYLQETDFTQLVDAPLSDNEKKLYAKYRTYLRDYTNQEEWWEQNPKTYDEWRK